jgi:CheY-like chemotaxis protein
LVRLWGHEVHVAHGGAHAITVAAEYQPDIRLVDIMMPRMDGYQVARWLRQNQKGTVLVAVTGLTGREHLQCCKEAGFVFRIAKPVPPASLCQMLGSSAAPPDDWGPAV